MVLPAYSPLKKYWMLDDEVVYLNHGSFGACPLQVLQKQDEYRKRLEQEPVKFMVRELEELIWQSKKALGDFIGARAEDLVFVPNATTGVNTVLNSLHFNEGDELLTTNHAYGACVNAMKWFAQKAKAKMVIAEIALPIFSPDEVTQAILAKVSSKTKLVMIDHITSPTGIVFPVEEIIAALNEKGIDCLVDGAHAPGQVDLQIEKSGVAYYTGNCHKWICSPKGSALLYVRKDKQQLIRPLSVSHAFDRPETKEKIWSSHFFWPGTNDYSSYLCVKDAIEFMSTLFPGGWNELKQGNSNLCLQARKKISYVLGTSLPAPENMIANLANIDLGKTEAQPFSFNYIHPVQNQLWNEFHIEVPIVTWDKNDSHLWVRIAVQCYNSMEQYEYLAQALGQIISG